MKYASITMGMLMYEDMKVSVLQLLLVRRKFHYERWGILLFFFSTYTDIEGVLLGRVQGKTYCPWRKVV